MIKRGLFLVLLAGCTKAGPVKDTPSTQTTTEKVTPIPAVAPIPQPAPKTMPAPGTTVELTSVTLADDCGGTPPVTSPPIKAKAKRDTNDAKGVVAYGKRRCEQTSMQLAINAADNANVQVKSVELFDDAGKSLGTLVASKPTKWTDARGLYEAWDESVAAGTTNVSYVLSQPVWGQVDDRANRTYTLKTVITIDGVDKAAQKQVTIKAQATIPPSAAT